LEKIEVPKFKLYKHQELALEQTKICSKCGKELELNLFSKNTKCKDGLNSWCKKCRKEYMKQYHKDNKERDIKCAKTYYKAHKVDIAKYKKSYDIENKNEISEYKKQNRERKRASIAIQVMNWKRNNKDKVNISKQNRRAKKRLLPSTLTFKQWESTKGYFDNQCCYCGQEALLTQEHFIPLSKGGEYTVNNIIPSCQRCNSSKGNREFATWYSKQFYYSKKRELAIKDFLER